MAQLNIDKLLKEYGLTQKDLSECTGINKNTVSKYCNGTFENINKMHIDLLCKFFDCSLNELFEVDDYVEVKNPNSIIFDNDTDKFIFTNKSIKELKIIIDNYNNPIQDSSDSSHDSVNSLSTIYKKNLSVEGIGKAVLKHTYNKLMSSFAQIPNEDTITKIEFSNKYYNKTSKILEQQMQRLDLEHDFEVNINTLLNIVIYSYDITIQERYKELIETYEDSKNFPLSFKLTSLYRVIYRLISIQSDSGLREFITKLRSIYIEGDLVQLTDGELNELFEVSKYYIDLINVKND